MVYGRNQLKSSVEPESIFPIRYYELFLDELSRRGIETFTYSDLFKESDDFDHLRNFPNEYESWEKRRDPKKTYLLIQHDIDNHPSFTQRMVEMEMKHGIRSNIFMFVDRASFPKANNAYEINHDFFLDAESKGFPIGYHQNALSITQSNINDAYNRYLSDVETLRKKYQVDFVVPHGGKGVLIDGETKFNHDISVPRELHGSIRWVYNKYGVRFQNRWSDGGIRKVRDGKKLEKLNLVGNFLDSLTPGTRNFCLIHPQKWGLRVNPAHVPYLSDSSWYSKVLREYV